MTSTLRCHYRDRGDNHRGALSLSDFVAACRFYLAAAMSTPLTTAQGAAIQRLLDQHGPGAACTAERDEDHDSHVFVAIYGADHELKTEKIIEGDGSYDD